MVVSAFSLEGHQYIYILLKDPMLINISICTEYPWYLLNQHIRDWYSDIFEFVFDVAIQTLDMNWSDVK